MREETKGFVVAGVSMYSFLFGIVTPAFVGFNTFGFLLGGFLFIFGFIGTLFGASIVDSCEVKTK